ncbi:hypothetical protein Ahy_A03g013713 [Arachis hypogaea]|uniref:MULE transposase domain-containing protein n=1 Tax=Arachis hypogaea TaxID=3818 RepID=A0A445DW12_ARAHY|nr:hypothetical protein Ahy_A03g013713 [Arachis hypogaea]
MEGTPVPWERFHKIILSLVDKAKVNQKNLWWLKRIIPSSVNVVHTNVDSTHLFEEYKCALLVVVVQDRNQNMVPDAFAIIEGKTANAWYFSLSNLRRHLLEEML